MTNFLIHTQLILQYLVHNIRDQINDMLKKIYKNVEAINLYLKISEA